MVELEADRIALAAAAIVPIIDPELVVLGGGIGRNGDLLLEPVTEALRAVTPFAVRLEVSPLGEEAVVLGAVWMALQAAQDLLFTRTNGVGRHLTRAVGWPERDERMSEEGWDDGGGEMDEAMDRAAGRVRRDRRGVYRRYRG